MTGKGGEGCRHTPIYLSDDAQSHSAGFPRRARVVPAGQKACGGRARPCPQGDCDEAAGSWEEQVPNSSVNAPESGSRQVSL